MLLYKTIAGSRLYGTNRPESDYDWIEVYSSMRSRPRHKVTEETDVIKISLSEFMRLAHAGSHQMLEAMFSPRTEIDLFYDMRSRYYAHTANTTKRYMATIQKFGDHKARKREKAMRTALRMTYNLEELLETGRFNPVVDRSLLHMLTYATWDEAHEATQIKLEELSERFGI